MVLFLFSYSYVYVFLRRNSVSSYQLNQGNLLMGIVDKETVIREGISVCSFLFSSWIFDIDAT